MITVVMILVSMLIIVVCMFVIPAGAFQNYGNNTFVCVALVMILVSMLTIMKHMLVRNYREHAHNYVTTRSSRLRNYSQLL